jgi:hypothetical protein
MIKRVESTAGNRSNGAKIRKKWGGGVEEVECRKQNFVDRRRKR